MPEPKGTHETRYAEGYQAGVEKGRAEAFEAAGKVIKGECMDARCNHVAGECVPHDRLLALAGACDRPPGGGEGENDRDFSGVLAHAIVEQSRLRDGLRKIKAMPLDSHEARSVAEETLQGGPR